ncbi:TetR family transcriptional regulator [Acrocarpospora phusangensis]|uniref:TetR family transcriptional regulator n=1 Tax=Acrocarpospora phusangensis TaxID=1070424 RepID=A0A919QCR7_9ACTN|nr:TetR/AcrR family transcriptional regulator [Acrocarpospora phusangensis]GIH25581.1 TetR family transcriptional regulator [Acrocarpospora phusangensis]
MSVTGTRPAGRPRSERAEKAIVDATLDLIGEGASVSELSIEAVAARAGVGKTTIYRRWANKEELVGDALATLKAPLPVVAGRTVREDLVAYLDVMRQDSLHVRTRCIMNIAMSDQERHPRLYERFHQTAIEPRRAAMRAVLERGVATGELRADLDVELAMGMLTGTMLWYTKAASHGGALPSPDLASRIVDEALRGFRSAQA